MVWPRKRQRCSAAGQRLGAQRRVGIKRLRRFVAIHDDAADVRAVYGTYTTPGTTYNVTRNFVTHVRLALQAGGESHARVDASVPLTNMPELLSSYWRTDFDRNPTTTNANGDASADWAMAGGAVRYGHADQRRLVCHRRAGNAAASRFHTNNDRRSPLPQLVASAATAPCLRINADRQGGQYAPILIYLRRSVRRHADALAQRQDVRRDDQRAVQPHAVVGVNSFGFD